MSKLGRVFCALRAWTGFADASESHLTPSHGWLLPVAIDARRDHVDNESRRDAARLRKVQS